LGHMAGDAVGGVMWRGMARPAFRGVTRRGPVRIVAGSAPKLFPGGLFAAAGGKRVGVSVHRNAFCGLREYLDIFGKIGAGTEVFEPLAGLYDARCAREVALFAGRIAAAGRELHGIYKFCVIGRVAVASFALNTVDDLPIPIECT